MIRKYNKNGTPDIDEAMKKLEKIETEKVERVEKTRKEEFNSDEMDTAFYFSVVFNTRKERDKWLDEHGIELEEDFFVKAEDFIK